MMFTDKMSAAMMFADIRAACYNIDKCFLKELSSISGRGARHMTVGVIRLFISINEAGSLKEKRQIIKSIKDRMKSRFNVSVSEVEHNDIWKNAVLGVACVSNDNRHVDSTMNSIVNFVENDGRVLLLDYSTERINV